MNSTLVIRDFIEEAAFSHPNVKEFGTGRDLEVSPGNDAKLIMVWLERPYRRRRTKNANNLYQNEYFIALQVLDKQFENENPDEKISRCDIIADHMVTYLTETYKSRFFIDDVDVISLERAHDGNFCGVRAEFTIRSNDQIKFCDFEL